MKLLSIFLIISFLAACAPPKKESVKTADTAAFKHKTIQASMHKKPTFLAMTAGKGAFAVTGVFFMAKAGNKLVKENNIQDPAIKIGNSLVHFMAKKYKMTANNSSPLTKGKSLSRLKSSYPKTNILIDVKTRAWNFSHYPTKRKRYGVTYSVNLRLINLNSKKVLIKNYCLYSNKPKDHTKALTHSQLVANGARGLKNELVKATQYCIKQFKASL